ncbi:hypothetical protein C8Q79DRAFT_964478 [Trametes meyenii]|nr:hypothetical protein C8Q79DRAFT_964478 [Trametes meyenii]
MTTNGPATSGFATLLRVQRGGRTKKGVTGRETLRSTPQTRLTPPPSSPPLSSPPRAPTPAPPRASTPAPPRASNPTPPHVSNPAPPRASTARPSSAAPPPASARPPAATSVSRADPSDEDTAPEDQHRDKRSRTTARHDADVIRKFEIVIKLHKQSDRIAEGVEYLYEAAQTLPRIIGTYVHYDHVLVDGLSWEGRYTDDDPEGQDMKWNTYWQVRYNFTVIKEYLPGFEEHAEYLRERPDLVGKLGKWMATVAGKARSSDITRVKAALFKTARLTDAALQRKTNRGFRHTETGRLLCPVKLLADFDDDPEGFCRKVYNMHDDRPRVAGGDWPAFMYDMRLYVPGKLKPGFLKSQLLLDIFKVVFTGPASADARNDYGPHARAKGKPPLSCKLQIREAAITTIVYIASLTRFALNTQTEWAEADGEWDGWDFAESIMTCMLRDPAWQEELTEWYTERVYGGVSNDTPATSSEPSAYELCMQEIEAEKRDRAAVETA